MSSNCIKAVLLKEIRINLRTQFGFKLKNVQTKLYRAAKVKHFLPTIYLYLPALDLSKLITTEQGRAVCRKAKHSLSGCSSCINLQVKAEEKQALGEV